MNLRLNIHDLFLDGQMSTSNKLTNRQVFVDFLLYKYQLLVLGIK